MKGWYEIPIRGARMAKLVVKSVSAGTPTRVNRIKRKLALRLKADGFAAGMIRGLAAPVDLFDTPKLRHADLTDGFERDRAALRGDADRALRQVMDEMP